MIQLDFKDRRPLFEQIKEKMKFLIINGALKENERIPSVRELASTLTINPHTIQRAYKEIEDECFIYSVKGKGSFVTPLKESSLPRQFELLETFKKTVLELRYLNQTKEDLILAIEKIYEEDSKK